VSLSDSGQPDTDNQPGNSPAETSTPAPHSKSASTTADHDRFTAVYNQLVPPVRSFLAKRVDYQVVDDLTADVFAVAWQKRHTVTEGEELPWLYRIAGYVVANHRRKAKRAFDLLSFFTVPDTAPAADAMVTHDPQLKAAWTELKPAWREALALVVIDDMSVTDAATVLGISPNTLSIRLYRAKKHLAGALATNPSPITETDTDADIDTTGHADTPASSLSSPGAAIPGGKKTDSEDIKQS
jgi:RNA polymerase sigma-70 factor (ECF subfamily)